MSSKTSPDARHLGVLLELRVLPISHVSFLRKFIRILSLQQGVLQKERERECAPKKMFIFSFPGCWHQGPGERGGSGEMETSEMAQVSWALFSFNSCPILTLTPVESSTAGKLLHAPIDAQPSSQPPLTSLQPGPSHAAPSASTSSAAAPPCGHTAEDGRPSPLSPAQSSSVNFLMF